MAARQRMRYSAGMTKATAVRIMAPTSWDLVVVAIGAAMHGYRVVGFCAAWIASVLVHELAHAVVARRYGGISEMRLGLSSGSVTTRRGLRPSEDLIVSAAGPAATLTLCVAGLVAAVCGLRELMFLATLNACLFVVNIWPWRDNDGRRIAAAWSALTRCPVRSRLRGGAT